MSKGELGGIVDLLTESGVLGEVDAAALHDAQAEALIGIMLNRNVLRPTDVPEARRLIDEASKGGSEAKRLGAQTSLVYMLARTTRKRMQEAGKGLAAASRRITRDRQPAVTASDTGPAQLAVATAGGED